MPHRLGRDFGLKLIAAGLAVAFWIGVAGQPVVERGLEAPLAFEHMPAALDVGGDLPDTVRVRVRGPSSIVNGLQPGDVVAVIDLADERPGRRLFDMFAGRVRAPFGVEVTQVVPAAVAVSIEPAGPPRAVAVVPAIEGRPADGFAVGRITADPASVAVVGPASRLDGVTEALTEPVSVDGASARVEARVTIGVADPLVRLRTPASAVVTVEIVPAPVARTLHDVPVRIVGGAAGGSRRAPAIEPAAVSVGVIGPPAVVHGLDPGAVEAVVDRADLGPGRHRLPVTVALHAADVSVTHIDPSRVTVTVR